MPVHVCRPSDQAFRGNALWGPPHPGPSKTCNSVSELIFCPIPWKLSLKSLKSISVCREFAKMPGELLVEWDLCFVWCHPQCGTCTAALPGRSWSRF
eukprot:1156198-Pelagomonas_calceolata.AAC.7